MRGSHDGSWELPHAMREGAFLGTPKQVDEEFDLIVVGGGIGGLSAAYFYRRQFDPDARILIIDDHDDFGGHAKRNEFWHDGKMHLRRGRYVECRGAFAIRHSSCRAVVGTGVDRTRYFESISSVKDRYKELGMKYGLFFDEAT